MGEKKKHTTLDQRIEIRDVLRQVLSQKDEDTWEYQAGVSDHTLAARFGVTVANISFVRKKLFGPLHKRVDRPAADPEILVLQQRCHTLEKDRDAILKENVSLRSWLAEVDQRLTNIEQKMPAQPQLNLVRP